MNEKSFGASGRTIRPENYRLLNNFAHSKKPRIHHHKIEESGTPQSTMEERGNGVELDGRDRKHDSKYGVKRSGWVINVSDTVVIMTRSTVSQSSFSASLPLEAATAHTTTLPHSLSLFHTHS